MISTERFPVNRRSRPAFLRQCLLLSIFICFLVLVQAPSQPPVHSLAGANGRALPLSGALAMSAALQQDSEYRLYLPVIEHYRPPTNTGIVDTFGARAEADLGVWGPFSDEWVFTRRQTWTDMRAWPRKMAANFVATADETRIAIYFSAEAYVDEPGRRLFVRALIDGVPTNPSDVVFATGTATAAREARAFVFTGMVDSGLHTVEIQWLVDEGATGYIRNAALMIRQSSGPTPREHAMVIVTPPSGPNLTHDQNVWVDIPGLSGSVYADAGEMLIATISAESLVSSGHSLFVRALVNGAPALPSDVLFARGIHPQARSMTFGLPNMGPGLHDVRFQWRVQEGGLATLGDRSMVLAAGQPSHPQQAQVFIAAPSGQAISTDSTAYSPIPDMQATGPIPANGEVVVLFSAETSLPASARLLVRLTINGQVAEASEVQLAHTDAHMGVQSFVFNAKHINAGQEDCLCTIQVEWRSGGGQTVSMGDRSMAILVKRGSVPDLAEPPGIGLGNVGIEPAIGPRHVLTILWDPQRPNMPAPSLSSLQSMLFGASDSASDYYRRVSGGKFTLENAGILGPYDAEENWQHYWQNPYPACDSPDTTGYTGGHQRKWAEALTEAGADFDFSAFDANGDGVLDPSEELAILIVIPQNTEDGFIRILNPYCSGDPFTVDGVIIPAISEWYAPAQNGRFIVPTHELAHLLLLLGDMYNISFNIATEAGRLSLMEQFFSAPHSPHIDGPSKLALGWVDPTIISQDSVVTLEDVKYSQNVIVLPRLSDGDGKEYFLLENRQDSANNPFYDEAILDQGIAVWHVVEDSNANGAVPNCVPLNQWNMIGVDNARRGIRLLRPTAAFNNVNSMWDATDYNLLDTGLVCPADGVAQNVLEWADGTASGYGVLNFSAAGQVMSFMVVVP